LIFYLLQLSIDGRKPFLKRLFGIQNGYQWMNSGWSNPRKHLAKIIYIAVLLLFLCGASMNNLHAEAGEPGVIIFRGVEVRDAPASQNGYAYLHVWGGSRDLPSHEIRVFLNTTAVNRSSSRTHPAFATDFMTYNSPVPPGSAVSARSTAPLAADQGSPQLLMDISDAFARLKPVARVDITMLFLRLNGDPIDVDRFTFDEIFITRLTNSKGE
jgi:hypothetical protein